MKCWRFLLSWSSYSINLLLFPSPRGPLARVIKRDVITRHGGPLQLQPPRNSASIRQRSRQREGGREGGREGERRGKKMARGREREREMGDKREEKIWAREERDKRKREKRGAAEWAEREEREIERGKRVILPGRGLIYHGQLSEGQAGPEDFCPEAISPQPSQVLSGLQLE